MHGLVKLKTIKQSDFDYFSLSLCGSMLDFHNAALRPSVKMIETQIPGRYQHLVLCISLG